MHGYHGTTKGSANLILEKSEFKFNKFVIHKNFIMPIGQRLPNDLGNGVYIFYQDDTSPFDALKNSKKYANQFKRANFSTKIGVIDVKLKTEINGRDCVILNLNDRITQEIFISYRENFFNSLYDFYKKSKPKVDGIYKRNNIDGIFLEYMIRYKYEDEVDLVIKDTYTPFYNSDRTISNFPNGREMCIRNVNLIDWEYTKEV